MDRPALRGSWGTWMEWGGSAVMTERNGCDLGKSPDTRSLRCLESATPHPALASPLFG